jgi:hypothetical protein
MGKFESEQDALEYLAANKGLLAAPINRILEDPRLDSARNALRAELAETVQPLIEAKRRAAVARLRWFLWDKLDRDPPPELAGVRLNVDPRPPERADAADGDMQKASAKARSLEADPEISVARVLLDLLDEG